MSKVRNALALRDNNGGQREKCTVEFSNANQAPLFHNGNDPMARNHSRTGTPFMESSDPLLQSTIAGYPCRRGKVRDIYDLGDRLVIVATDRISAFDWVLPTGIPDKGRILTRLSRYWFGLLGTPNHFISDDLREMGPAFTAQASDLLGRSMLVYKAKVVPVECVVRGYLAGSGWREYKQMGTVCGVRCPAGLREGDRLPEAIFTPATKAEHGHDINITVAQMADIVGQELTRELSGRSVAVYEKAAEHARSKGIIIADTKFEWGQLPDGSLILVDEVLTPDSSRFWPLAEYKPGSAPPSLDKQFIRNWLETTGWDKSSPPPPIPADLVARTREIYIEAFEQLTGEKF